MGAIKIQSGFQKRLRDVLTSGLASGGIHANVRWEKSLGTKLTRVLVTSPAFKRLRAMERQDLVWRIVGRHFNGEEQLRISMIMTVSPAEMNSN